jgi:hypothetical protein
MSRLPDEIWDGNGGTIDAKNAPLRDLVIALHVKMDDIVIPTLKDHEKRIRGEERFRLSFPSLGTLSFVVSALSFVLFLWYYTTH